jgi:hypothetical protein
MVSKEWMIVNSALERMCKDRDAAYCKVQPNIHVEGPRKTTRKLKSEQSAFWKLPPEYKVRRITV